MRLLKRKERICYDGVIEWIKYLGKFTKIDIKPQKPPKDFEGW